MDRMGPLILGLPWSGTNIRSLFIFFLLLFFSKSCLFIHLLLFIHNLLLLVNSYWSHYSTSSSSFVRLSATTPASIFYILSHSFCFLHAWNSSSSMRHLSGHSSPAFTTLIKRIFTQSASSTSNQDASDVLQLSTSSIQMHWITLLQLSSSSSISMEQVHSWSCSLGHQLVPPLGMLPSTLGYWKCWFPFCTLSNAIMVCTVTQTGGSQVIVLHTIIPVFRSLVLGDCMCWHPRNAANCHFIPLLP